MTKLVGIAGSLRAGSLNMALLKASADLLPDAASMEIGSIAAIPLYNADIEQTDGIPEAVARLQDQIAAADGLVIATPEYNNAMPGVLKNAMDWLSRPPNQIRRVFGDLPVALMGASPGGFGTVMAQAAWLPVLKTLGARPWSGARMLVSQAAQSFDANGALTDVSLGERIREFMAGFVEFVNSAG
jgi:chromate reductase